MTECLQRQLNSPLQYHAINKWREMLPTVLLGFHRALKPDLKATVAELMNGQVHS